MRVGRYTPKTGGTSVNTMVEGIHPPNFWVSARAGCRAPHTTTRPKLLGAAMVSMSGAQSCLALSHVWPSLTLRDHTTLAHGSPHSALWQTFVILALIALFSVIW